MGSNNADQIYDLDAILSELGQFGRFQIKNYILLTIPILVSGIYTISFVFTAANPQYRCFVPECENLTETTFHTEWLKNAIPYKNDEPTQCYRYENVHTNDTIIFNNGEEFCPSFWFERNEIQCNDGYVFNTDHRSIANDFDILCKDQWKLTLPGTIHNIGQFVSQPLTGIVSDKFGRKFAMSIGLLASVICGISRSFSPNYLWFVTFEFLDAAIGSAVFASAFILGTEFVNPSKRVLMSSIICSGYAFGEALVGIIAWNVLSWRRLLQYLYGPGLILIVYFWISPESVRWLIAKGRHKQVEKIIKNAAKQNGVTLSDKSLAVLEANAIVSSESKTTGPKEYTLTDVLKNISLLFRIINCSICWITCVFVYFGLSLHSVEIAGNIHLNFIAVSLVEIPGYLATYLCLDRFGRKKSLCGSFIIAGICCLSFIFVTNEFLTLKLILFSLGKCAITMSFVVIYVYTAELFPTPLRQTLLGLCSMFGRIGAMVAPQMPLLSKLWEPLPVFSFGVMSCISGLLVLFFPETLNIKLPDTIEEAVNIGKKV